MNIPLESPEVRPWPLKSSIYLISGSPCLSIAHVVLNRAINFAANNYNTQSCCAELCMQRITHRKHRPPWHEIYRHRSASTAAR
eukprot:COSAG02_NODE_7722_length_2875_cov_23.682277_2_plen_84_part_00